MPKIPEIKGSCFVLRALNPEKDKEVLWRNINHPDIINNLTIDYPYTEKQWDWFVDYNKKIKKDEIHDLNWMIYINEECVGSVGIEIKDGEWNRHVGSLGYWLAKKHWGKGIVTEAVRLACDYAFKEAGLLRLKLWYLKDNVGSKRVAEKNGFKVEGVMVGEAFRDGEYKDVVCVGKNKKF